MADRWDSVVGEGGMSLVELVVIRDTADDEREVALLGTDTTDQCLPHRTTVGVSVVNSEVKRDG